MDTDVIAGEEGVSVPFHVIGLQQMVLDGQLTLQAAIIPVKQFTARDLRSRSKVDAVWWLSVIIFQLTS